MPLEEEYRLAIVTMKENCDTGPMIAYLEQSVAYYLQEEQEIRLRGEGSLDDEKGAVLLLLRKQYLQETSNLLGQLVGIVKLHKNIEAEQRYLLQTQEVLGKLQAITQLSN